MFQDKFDARKAIEAVSILANESGGKIGSKRLLALLYIANRECLKRSGRPLVGGRLMAMRYGPIHGDVYSLIKEDESADGIDSWSNHFHLDGYNVVLDADPGVNALSRFELKLLQEVIDKYKDEDDWDVGHKTHDFPEYKQTYRKGRRIRRIPLEQMIYAVGLGPMASSIVRDLKEKQEIDEVFAGVKEPIRRKRSTA